MTKKIIYILLASWILTGCLAYPDDAARTEDLDSVITLFDRSKDLSDYITYALVEELLPISPDPDGVDNPFDIFNPDDAMEDFILEKIEENMDARGYTRVADAQDADLIINAGYVVVSTTVIQEYGCYDPWSWYWGGGWYGPGYGWGYPDYGYYYPYPCTYVYSYDVGTVIVQMYDNKVTVNDAFNVAWLGVLRGLANGVNEFSRVEFGIDQAFEQTPIL